MRRIKITEKIGIEVDCLTRGNIKKLFDQGFNVNPMTILHVSDTEWDKFIEALMRAYNPVGLDDALGALDGLKNKDYRRVCRELIAETWGSEEEEKNS